MGEQETGATPEMETPAETPETQEVKDAKVTTSAAITVYVLSENTTLENLRAAAVTVADLRAIVGKGSAAVYVGECFKGIPMTDAERKRRMSALNYRVRTIEAEREGKPTPSQVIAQAAKNAREAAVKVKASAGSTPETTEPTPAIEPSDGVKVGRVDPVTAMRTVTQLLNGVNGALTGKGDIARETLVEIGKALKLAEQGCADVRANLISRGKALQTPSQAA